MTRDEKPLAAKAIKKLWRSSGTHVSLKRWVRASKDPRMGEWKRRKGLLP